MKSVWVVEKGSHDEYRVLGVYSTEANAQLIADKANEMPGQSYGDEASVAEWAIDPGVDAITQGMTRFLVDMRRDGTVERIEPYSTTYFQAGDDLIVWYRSQALHRETSQKPDILHGTAWAKDAAHAIEVANSERTRLIESNQWEEA